MRATKKFFAVFLIAFLLLPLLTGCRMLKDTADTIIEIYDYAQTGTYPPEENSETPFDMERVAEVYLESGTMLVRYFRDVGTDVMYVSTSKSGGLSVMLDPETGLPLTYTRYVEYYSSNIPEE